MTMTMKLGSPHKRLDQDSGRLLSVGLVHPRGDSALLRFVLVLRHHEPSIPVFVRRFPLLERRVSVRCRLRTCLVGLEMCLGLRVRRLLLRKRAKKLGMG